jgi:hypothetical protein
MCKLAVYLQVVRLKQRSDIAWEGSAETYSETEAKKNSVYATAGY